MTRILLAEDDEDMRRFLVKALQRAGYDVIDFDNGASAYERLREEPFSLLLSALVLPEMDGITVCKEIRKTSEVPVIMLTARTDDTESQALELGAQDYLTKPVQPRSLVARVRAVLKRTRME